METTSKKRMWEILKANNFKRDKELQWYTRDDWYWIELRKSEYIVCDWVNSEQYLHSPYEVIWYLAIHNIIPIYC